MTSTTTIADVASKIAGVTNRGAWTSKPTAIGKVTIPKGYHNGSGYVDTSNFTIDGGLVLGIIDISNYINARGGYVIYGAITTGKEYDLSKYKYIQLIFQHYNYYDETWGVGFTKNPNDTLANCQNATTKQTYSHAGNSQDSFITKSIYLDISGINEKGYPFVYRVGSVYSYVIKLQLVNKLEVF